MECISIMLDMFNDASHAETSFTTIPSTSHLNDLAKMRAVSWFMSQIASGSATRRHKVALHDLIFPSQVLQHLYIDLRHLGKLGRKFQEARCGALHQDLLLGYSLDRV